MSKCSNKKSQAHEPSFEKETDQSDTVKSTFVSISDMSPETRENRTYSQT